MLGRMLTEVLSGEGHQPNARKRIHDSHSRYEGGGNTRRGHGYFRSGTPWTDCLSLFLSSSLSLSISVSVATNDTLVGSVGSTGRHQAKEDTYIVCTFAVLVS